MTDVSAAVRRVGVKAERGDGERREHPSPERYEAMRRRGTERSFTGPSRDSQADGLHGCICCGRALSDAATAFDAGTGWPSFSARVDPRAVVEHRDTPLLMRRAVDAAAQVRP